jgi:hypothetical protein
VLLVKKDDKGKDFLKDKNLDKINGGKNTTYNKEVQGNGNIVGVNANFEQMLGAIDKMNKSGKLDYLKKK